MSHTLYIIGNGFDLHHGLRTSYGDFRAFIKRKPDIWRRLQALYGTKVENDLWWSNFEAMLAKVDYKHLMRAENGMTLGPTWADVFLRNHIPVFFGEWISHVDDNAAPDPSLHLDTDAQYFTFNYTIMLEKAYGIEERNVWHIHNSVQDFRSGMNPVVGHDSDSRRLFLQLSEYMQSNPDVRYDVADLVNQNIAEGAKKVSNRIDGNEEMFHTRYSSIKRFIAMGFSFNDIDMPYIEKIVEVNRYFFEADWLFYCHSDEDFEKFRHTSQRLGINPGKVHFEKW